MSSNKRIRSFRFDRDLLSAAERAAKLEHRSTTNWIEVAIKVRLAANRRKNGPEQV